VKGIRSDEFVPSAVVAVSTSVTFPIAVASDAVLKLNVDCHLPGAIEASVV